MGDVLNELVKTKDFLICIDSDGCLLDNMELKHKECFCPATVNVWEMQGASKYLRECHEFVNLYSRTRGFNRFPAVVRTLELTYARPEVKARGYILPDLTELKEWIATTPKLSAAAIDEYVSSHPDCSPLMQRAAQWSREVDENIARIVRNIHPFPGAKDAIEKMREFADVVIVSATPHDALVRELSSCGIAQLMSAIAGQELGTKSQCIRKAMEGRYDPDHVLKIGDAVSDYAAAQENGVLFNPIVPGSEAASWENIRKESLKKFRNGSFKGEYMDSLVNDFLTALPENPSWI